MPSTDDAPGMPEVRRSRFERWLPLVFVVAALVWLWPIALDPTAIPFAPRGQYSDLLLAHLPNAEYLRRSVLEWGELPLWTRWRLGGMPFAADPLSGLWYPPNWLLVVLPGSPGFNLLFVAHLALAGWGMYAFLCDAGLSTAPAVAGGLFFSGAPKLVAHTAAGHVSLVQAVAWTPWLMLCVRRSDRSSLRWAALAGGTLALVALADLRWAFYAGGFAAAYWLSARDFRRLPGLGSLIRSPGVKAALTFGVVLLLTTSILSLPLIEFLPQTTRAALTFDEAAVFSLPPRYLLGLLIPDLGGFHEWMTYSGLAVLMLALAAILSGRLVRRDGFWPIAAALAAWLSLGSETAVYRGLFAFLPGLNWLRVPPRAMFLVAFSFVVLAAMGLESLSAGLDGRARRRLSLGAVAGFASGLLLGGAFWALAGGPRPNVSGFLILATATGALVLLRSHGRLAPRAWLVLASALAVGDLVWVNSSLIEARPLAAPSNGNDLAEYLAAQPGRFRVYSPSYSLPHEAAARHSLEQVDGVNPMQLSSTAAFVRAASGTTSAGYSVTLPALGADPATNNRDAVPDARLLGLLNVRFVAAEFDLNAPGLTEVATFGGTRLYENEFAMGEAWLAFRAVPAGGAAAALALAAEGQTAVEAGREIRGSSGVIAVPAAERAGNRIKFDVDLPEPGLLVTSEIFYPGWVAVVDGRAAPIVRVDGLLRGVYLDAGQHRVSFEFRPRSVLIGGVGTGLGLLVVMWAVMRREGKRP